MKKTLSLLVIVSLTCLAASGLLAAESSSEEISPPNSSEQMSLTVGSEEANPVGTHCRSSCGDDFSACSSRCSKSDDPGCRSACSAAYGRCLDACQ